MTAPECTFARTTMHGTERRRADCSLQKEASRKGDPSTLPLSASHVLTVLGVHCNLTHPLQAPAAVRGARKGSFPAAWPPSWPGWRLVSRRRRAGLPSATEMEEQWVVSVLSSASVGAVQSDTQTFRSLLFCSKDWHAPPSTPSLQLWQRQPCVSAARRAGLRSG